MLPDVDEEFVRARSRRADLDEKARTELRASSREASVACLFFSLVGVFAFFLCFVAGFDLAVLTSSVPESSVGAGGALLLSKIPTFDLTVLAVGASAAGFAATIVIVGGSALQLRRMPVSTIYTVLGSGAVAVAGLLLLTLAG